MPATDWLAIEKWMMVTEDYPAAARHFNVKEDTIRKRAKRHGWMLPSVVAKAVAVVEAPAAKSKNGALTASAAKTLAERGEAHAEMVFEKANAALAALKKFPVRNARDVELIDKVARRSAGMGNDDEGVKISLISLNEAIESHRDDDVLEATLIPDNPDSGQPKQLDDASSADVNHDSENQGDSNG